MQAVIRSKGYDYKLGKPPTPLIDGLIAKSRAGVVWTSERVVHAGTVCALSAIESLSLSLCSIISGQLVSICVVDAQKKTHSVNSAERTLSYKAATRVQ